jgi:Zn-dependent peptidase ImmA (M78 family)
MSYIDAEGIPVAGISMEKIELQIHKYLEKYHPETIKTPSSLDIDSFLEVSLFKSHRFMVDIVSCFENSTIQARTLMDKKFVQITMDCHNKLGADDGKARFDVGHEGAHVILHTQQYQEFLLNPAWIVKRECEVYENAEWQAEHGGGALLMPLETLIPLIGQLQTKGCKYSDIVYEIMDNYKVTGKAVRSRLNQFPKPGFRRLMRFFSKQFPEFDINLFVQRQQMAG